MPKLPRPTPKETLPAGAARLLAEATGEDCQAAAAVSWGTTDGLSKDQLGQRCAKSQKRFKGFSVKATAPLGVHGGVVQLVRDKTTAQAIVLSDSEGLYRVVELDWNLPNVAISEPVAPGDPFGRLADRVTAALASKDCGKVIPLMQVSISRDKACELVEGSLGEALQKNPKLPVSILGADRHYALAQVTRRKTTWVLVLARQSDETWPKGRKPLPAGAPKYAFLTTIKLPSTSD